MNLGNKQYRSVVANYFKYTLIYFFSSRQKKKHKRFMKYRLRMIKKKSEWRKRKGSKRKREKYGKRDKEVCDKGVWCFLCLKVHHIYHPSYSKF